MPRYRNGEILDTEIRREEEEQAQQPEAAARQMVTGTPVYGLGGNTANAYTNIADGTNARNIFSGANYGKTGSTNGVTGIAAAANGNTGILNPAGGAAMAAGTQGGVERTPLTFTDVNGNERLDPRGASTILTQFSESQKNEPTLEESERTQAALERLQNWENNRLDPWQSRYDTQIDAILQGLGDREGFSYNPAEDPLYRNYRDQYIRLGNRAMQDTMANAAGLTGGYGNTYAQGVGQQAYQDYLSGLNAQIPGLYDRAYQQYRDDQDAEFDRLNALLNRDSTDYARYRDLVGDYLTDRNYYAGRYDTENANDLARYSAELAQWQDDRNFYYNMLGKMVDDPVVAAAVSQLAGEYATDTSSGSGNGGGGGRGSSNRSGSDQRLTSKDFGPLDNAITKGIPNTGSNLRTPIGVTPPVDQYQHTYVGMPEPARTPTTQAETAPTTTGRTVARPTRATPTATTPTASGQPMVMNTQAQAEAELARIAQNDRDLAERLRRLGIAY